tara:strand:- start:1114 stop:1503 length:390 start_codon:yes stop_codon:yes gene_type:complete
MNLLNLEGENIKGCLSFKYKGYEVSSSNILDKFFHIAVFEEDTGLFKGQFSNIPEAINWIENPDPILNYLKEHLTVEEYSEVIKEDFNDIKLNDFDGLLSLLSILFCWGSSKKGYDYWYDVAHKEYTEE